jgi:hypothetical protein
MDFGSDIKSLNVTGVIRYFELPDSGAILDLVAEEIETKPHQTLGSSCQVVGAPEPAGLHQQLSAAPRLGDFTSQRTRVSRQINRKDEKCRGESG